MFEHDEAAAPEAPDTTDAAPSRREAIEAAFEAAETPAEAPQRPSAAPEVEAATPDGVDAEQQPSDKPRDDKGRFKQLQQAAKGKLGTPATEKPVATVKPVEKSTPMKGGGAAPPNQAQQSEASALKAPSSWKPQAREKWASLPPEVQAEAVRLDREVKQTLQQTAEARKFHESFQQVVQPYAGMLQAEGTEPMRAVASLFQTAAALRTAPPATKAQLVANMVHAFGIPIALLDQALVGRGPTAQQMSTQQSGPLRDPRVDELFQRLQSAQSQQQQAAQQRYAQEVEDFSTQHEFADDVREEMADILEVASKRGVAMTLEDAYNRAIQLHPGTREVMQQREAAKAANAAQASTQRARTAAASVRSRPAGHSGQPAPQGRRGALEMAFDLHNGNR